MTTLYARQQASSLATLRRKGAAVTFTNRIRGTLDTTTNLYSGSSTSTVAGYAIRDQGNPETYRRLGLTEREAPTLLFGPSTAGELPPLGAEVSWGGVTYTVRDINPIAPDGTAIVAQIVVGR